MNKLETRLKREINHLRVELKKTNNSKEIFLNEKQKKEYEEWNSSENVKKENISAYKDEKDYLIRELKYEINSTKQKIFNLICEEKGHAYNIKNEWFNDGKIISGICERCKSPYDRYLTQEEIENWNNELKGHFII
ncbi:MAG: hypothetical protein WC812_03310 [Candidatus Pacearchaeota archaeon]|jgi:formylmethanofuran dehydrogenase subunit E